MSNSFESPDGQRVSFIELFFDLIYVYSITQIVTLISHKFDLLGVFQGFLVFWLVWWSWTQVAWALNAANTENPFVQVSTMFITVLAFLMVISIPDAFSDKALWFVTCYILIRITALTVYSIAGRNKKNTSHAIKIFTIASFSGLFLSLLGVITDVNTRYALWSLVIVFDFIAAYIGGKNEGWDLDPDHFSERHGLFIIIALGESLIVSASGFTSGTQWDLKLLIIAILAIIIVGGFWWNYFIQTKPILDKAFEIKTDIDRTTYARDTYSLIHVIIISGIISYAIGLEHLLEHWQESVSFENRLTIVGGVVLFFGGLIIAVYRGTKYINVPKDVFILLASIAIIFSGIEDSMVLLTIITVFIISMIFIIKITSKNLNKYLELIQ